MSSHGCYGVVRAWGAFGSRAVGVVLTGFSKVWEVDACWMPKPGCSVPSTSWASLESTVARPWAITGGVKQSMAPSAEATYSPIVRPISPVVPVFVVVCGGYRLLPVGVFQALHVSIVTIGALVMPSGQEAIPAVFFIGYGRGVATFMVGRSVAGATTTSLGVGPGKAPGVKGIVATVGASLVSSRGLCEHSISVAYDVVAVLISHLFYPAEVPA